MWNDDNHFYINYIANVCDYATFVEDKLWRFPEHLDVPRVPFGSMNEASGGDGAGAGPAVFDDEHTTSQEQQLQAYNTPGSPGYVDRAYVFWWRILIF